MGHPRLVNFKAIPACFTVLTAFMAVMSSSGFAQPAPTQRQRAVCSLNFLGASDPETQEPMVAVAELECNSSSPVSIGVNTTYLGKHVPHFTGVQVVSGLPCQQQAQGRWSSSGGTSKSLLAMLYFCGDYDITLLQPRLLNMTLKQNSSDWGSAVLAFGGSTTATIRQGSFVGNSAGSAIVAFQTATLQVEHRSVFDHNSGFTGTGIWATDEANLVVRDATFSYNTATMNGGALGCNDNASMSIDSCLFHNNAASSMGGAVEISCISSRQATVSNTTFQGNSADFGGAAYLDVNMSISIENGNLAANHASRSGGGIYLDSGSAITAVGCTFDKNNASYYGGGLLCDGCSVQAGRLSFTHNNAVTSGGGLAAFNQAQINMTSSTWHGNTADYGAGIVFNNDVAGSLSSQATLNISESTFNNNIAKVNGGACGIAGFVLAKLDSNTLTHNNAANYGGGLYAYNQTQATVSNTTFHENGAVDGGAAYLVVNTTINIENSSFAANHASRNGGGIYLDSGSAVTAVGCTFDMNNASFGGGLLCNGCSVQAGRLSFTHNNASYGGGLFCDGCSVQAGRLSFTNNNAVTSGGGLYAVNQAQIKMTSSTWHGNTADYGAGIVFNNDVAGSLSSQATLNISESTFNNNIAKVNGGACGIAGFVLAKLHSNTLTHNNAANSGGGLYAYNQTQATVSNTTFQGNSAGFGGAAYLDVNTTVSIENSSFTANHASTSGGSMYLNTSSAVIATWCTFDKNNASYGGGLFCDGCSVQAGRLSFTNNNAGKYGGGLRAINEAQIKMTSSTWQGNTADYGAGIAFTNDVAGNLSSQATLNISESTFNNNTAKVTGGACSIVGFVQAKLHSNTLTHNNAANSGGGLYAYNQTQASVSNTTFQENGAGFGGAAFLDVNATISIDNSSFTANHASSSGGSMYLNTSSAVIATGCSFDMNNASYGGGVVCDGCSVQAGRLSFTHNNAASYGGGLYALDAQINMTSSTWQGNTAVTGGGVAFGHTAAVSISSPATLNMSKSTFTDNNATRAGGACYLEGFIKAKLDSNTWRANSASLGGAMYFIGPSSTNNSLGVSSKATTMSSSPEFSSSIPGNTAATGSMASKIATVDVSSNGFIDNSGSNYGGAVYLEQLVDATFVNSHMVHNDAGMFGGGLACQYSGQAGQVTLRDCRLSVNSAEVAGGAVYSASCQVEIIQSSIEACTSTGSFGLPGGGGGLFHAGTSKVVMADSTISGCIAGVGGAVALLEQAILHVNGSSFWNNTANVGNGGVVTADGTSRTFVKDSTFVGNRAVVAGGALFATQSAQMFVSHNCSFVNNSAANGGAIGLWYRANLTLSNSSLLNNSADYTGGALLLGETSVALVTAGSSIAGNNAGDGGGVYTSDNSLTTINGDSRVQGNAAANGGGGVCATDSAQVLMAGTTVSGNHVTGSGGGLYFDKNARGNLTGCQVMLNEAAMNGGGLFSVGQTVLALRDCLVANNSARHNGGGIGNVDSAQLMLLGDTSVTGNHADFGWGGGVSLFSGSFDLGQVTGAVHNNSGPYDVDVQSKLTHLTIIGNTSIYGFANCIGKGDGLLPVVVNVSGYYGLPCQRVQVQAELQGTFLGLNHSDEHGLVQLGLRIARPPGVYVISLSSPDLPVVNLTLHVRNCTRGEVTPSPDACQPCQQGFFSFDPSQRVCSTCPGNANCSGGDVITPLPGYWRSARDSVQIHRCPNPSACNPASDSALLACAADRMCGTSTTYKDLQCAPGYYGNVCGLCLPGTGATRLFVCRGCMKSGYIIALYVSAAIVLLCLIMLMCHLNRKQDAAVSEQDSKVPAAQLLRPLLLYSQYMLVVSSMPVEWPASIGYPLKVLAWVWSPASPETLSIDCLLPRGTHLPISIQKVLFYVCMPLVVLGLLLLVEIAQVQYLRVQKRHVALQVKDWLHSSALVAVFFFYPSILRNLFSMFACIPIDQPAAAPYTPAAIGSYWVMDMNQQCFTGYHRAWSLGFGLPCIILVCLGLPLGLLVLMLNKRADLAEPTFRQHYGFLYMSYRQPMYCWECVVMTQTMVLVAISVFGVNLGVFYQVIVMNAALILMWTLLLIFKPYAYQQAGKVMLQAVFCLLLTSYTALTFLHWGVIQPSPQYGIIMGCVVLLVNLVYVVSVVWQMIRLVNWSKVWYTIKRIWSKLKCSHGCISRLAGIGVRRGREQQTLVAMALFSQQHTNSAPTSTV